MYSQENLNQIEEQFRKRLAMLGLLLLLPLAALVVSLALRIKWLTMLASILAGSLTILYVGMSLSPVFYYRKHLRLLLPGRKRELSGVFKGFEEHPVLRDKVRFYGFLLNIGELDDPIDDRQLYWDANLPLPDWQEGERFWVSSFDKSVVDWKRI